MRRGFVSTFAVWRDEFKKVYRDLGVLMFFVIAPLGYPLLYSYVYNNEVVREVKAVVVDNCDTQESREMRRMIDATANVNIVGTCANMEEAREAMRRHEAYGIIEVPKTFSKDIIEYKQTYVKVYSDMSSLLYYKAIALSVIEVSQKMNGEIQARRAGNYSEREDEILKEPLKYEEIAYFNKGGGYASFLIPPVLVLIIQQMILLGIGMACGTERESNTTHTLVPQNNKHLGTIGIVFGKSMCYLVVWGIMTIYLLWLVPLMFDLPQEGHVDDLAAFAVPYVLACIFFSMTMGGVVRERETTFLLFVCTSIFLLFISGVSWPESAIPEAWKKVAYIFPSSMGIQGYVKLSSMGGMLSDVKHEYVTLWMQTAIYFVTACMAYGREVRRSKKAQNA